MELKIETRVQTDGLPRQSSEGDPRQDIHWKIGKIMSGRGEKVGEKRGREGEGGNEGKREGGGRERERSGEGETGWK